MVNKAEFTCLAAFSFIALLALGGFSGVYGQVSSAQSSCENQAYSCLTNVLNIDLSYYTVQQQPDLTLPSVPNNTAVIEQVSYNLTSSDSNVIVIFLFSNGALYQIAVRPLSGSVVTARNYTNLNDAAVDFLSRYQSVSAVDLTPLVKMVDALNGTMGAVHAGNLTLNASSGPIVPGNTATSYDWYCSTDNSTVSIGFDNGVLYNFEYFGFTSQDSAAATDALTASTPTTTPAALPPNLSIESQPSTDPTANGQAKQTERTLTYMIAVLVAIIAGASIILAYQRLKTVKAKAANGDTKQPFSTRHFS